MENNNNKQNHDNSSPSPKRPPSTAPSAMTTAGGTEGGGDRLKREAPSTAPGAMTTVGVSPAGGTGGGGDRLKREAPSTAPGAMTTAGMSPAGGGTGDRLKRDEWSEGAVSCLLEAYEAKWILRNRAKLKGHDWEDVAKFVSSRGANSSKSPKTQTQCKNKIESMKKRYRSESANTSSDVSSWPLFPRLDLLLRGTGGVPPPVTVAAVASGGGSDHHSTVKAFDQTPGVQTQTLPTTIAATMIQSSNFPVVVSVAPAVAPTPVIQGITGQNSVDSNGVDQEHKEDVVCTKITDNEPQPSEKMEIESDCSTPALYSNEKENIESKAKKMTSDSRKRRRKGENWYDVAESIRWLAKVMVRSEQAKVETMRELEKMRVDAEIKRGEIDLKRTEIIARTQLEIAKIFANSMGKNVDPSLRIGRS